MALHFFQTKDVLVKGNRCVQIVDAIAGVKEFCDHKIEKPSSTPWDIASHLARQSFATTLIQSQEERSLARLSFGVLR
jgi:hypothetical protein